MLCLVCVFVIVEAMVGHVEVHAAPAARGLAAAAAESKRIIR